jgi:hypothetical protein
LIGSGFNLVGDEVKTLPCPFPLADDLGIDNNNLRIKFADCLCLNFLKSTELAPKP